MNDMPPPEGTVADEGGARTAQDVMRVPALCLEPGMRIDEAVDLMRRQRADRAAVEADDAGHFGIVHAGHLAALRKSAPGSTTTVGEVCRRLIAAVPPHASLASVASLMEMCDVTRVAVTDGPRLVGIVDRDAIKGGTVTNVFQPSQEAG